MRSITIDVRTIDVKGKELVPSLTIAMKSAEAGWAGSETGGGDPEGFAALSARFM